MLCLVVYAGQLILLTSCAAVAYISGGVPERRGALWFAANYTLGSILLAVKLDSPTITFVLDAIYAIGLLPLAIIYVSWWVGAMTLMATAAFSLEAVYLVQEWPTDRLYLICTNMVAGGTASILLMSALANLIGRRRRARAQASTKSGRRGSLAQADVPKISS
jgi:hypothetical protein